MSAESGRMAAAITTVWIPQVASDANVDQGSVLFLKERNALVSNSTQLKFLYKIWEGLSALIY